MLVLALDTSTPTVTAGVLAVLRPHEVIDATVFDATVFDARGSGPVRRPVRLLAERTLTDAFGHAEHLLPLATAALRQAGHRFADLDALVVGVGPGPFTGLRVGIATAAALGDGLGVPVHPIGSHDALARAHLDGTAGTPPVDFLVATDARRREVYLSAYSGSGRRLFGPAPVRPAAVPAILAEHALAPGMVVGAGAGLLDGALALPAAGGQVSISTGLVLAAARALVTSVVPAPLAPLYLRRPDATEPAPRKSVLGA